MLVPKITDEFDSLISFAWYGMCYLILMGASYHLWRMLFLHSALSVKKTCFLAVTVFSLGTLACAFASNVILLMLGRAVVACGAGGMHYACSVVLNFGPKRPESHKIWNELLLAMRNLVPCLGTLMGGTVVYVCFSFDHTNCSLTSKVNSTHGVGPSIFALGLGSLPLSP